MIKKIKKKMLVKIINKKELTRKERNRISKRESEKSFKQG